MTFQSLFSVEEYENYGYNPKYWDTLHTVDSRYPNLTYLELPLISK